MMHFEIFCTQQHSGSARADGRRELVMSPKGVADPFWRHKTLSHIVVSGLCPLRRPEFPKREVGKLIAPKVPLA